MKIKSVLLSWKTYLGLAVVISLVVMAISILFFMQAEAIGSTIGTKNGTAVGSFQGSIEGLTEGSDAGALAGLAAENTDAEIQNVIDSVGKLQVMVAGVTLKNFQEIGSDYRNLSIISGEIVFTVDFSQTEISHSSDGSKIVVLTTKPTPTLYLDQSSTQVLAEIQNFSWSVDAEDGLQAYLNSMVKIEEQVEESVGNYREMLTSAEQYAKIQIEQLIKSAGGQGKTIHIDFKDEVEITE